MRRPFIITGTVVEIRLTNPHSIVVFEAPDPKAERQDGEVAGRNGWWTAIDEQLGWTKDSPKIGDKITLNGRRVKSGAPYMNMTEKAQIVLDRQRQGDLQDTELRRAADAGGEVAHASNGYMARSHRH